MHIFHIHENVVSFSTYISSMKFLNSKRSIYFGINMIQTTQDWSYSYTWDYLWVTVSCNWGIIPNPLNNRGQHSLIWMNVGCATVGCATAGCATVGCATVGCATVGCATVGCATVICATNVSRHSMARKAVWPFECQRLWSRSLIGQRMNYRCTVRIVR